MGGSSTRNRHQQLGRGIMKDLLFGASDLYTWDKVKPWAESIRDSGFDGDVVLLVYRADMDTFTVEADKLDIQLIHTDRDNHGRLIDHNAGGRDTQCHQMRFFHMWQFLSQRKEIPYERVITTDVRDVIFQRNPTEWLNQHEVYDANIVAPSEGIKYGKEAWNKDNMAQGFGPYVSQYTNEHTVYNVGTIAGGAYAMRDLALLIFSMGEGRYIPNDQSSFGLLMNGSLFDVVPASMNDAWCCQCASTLEPERAHVWPHLLEDRPVIKDGYAYTTAGEMFYLLHQYDRVPELKESVEARYGV